MTLLSFIVPSLHWRHLMDGNKLGRLGQAADISGSFQLFERASILGCSLSTVVLGLRFYYGRHSMLSSSRPDYGKALECFQRALSQIDPLFTINKEEPLAHYWMGRCYEFGDVSSGSGTRTADVHKAMYHYSEALRLGSNVTASINRVRSRLAKVSSSSSTLSSSE